MRIKLKEEKCLCLQFLKTFSLKLVHTSLLKVFISHFNYLVIKVL